MKINPDIFFIDDKNINYKNNIFLISGNEETFVYEVQQKIEKKLFNLGYSEKKVFENVALDNMGVFSDNNSLFSSLKTLVFKNPKNINTDFLANIDLENLSIIITDSKIKNSSKVKKKFELSERFYSTTCYDLNRSTKKKLLDNLIKNKKITLEKDAYWFFLDKTDNRFGIFNNELKKLVALGNKKISINEMKFVVDSYEDQKLDALFFSVFSSSNTLIYESQKNIGNLSDSYLLLYKAKFYLNLILASKDIHEATNNFPKYLFSEKQNFISFYTKIKDSKIADFLNLIKRTEVFLRKNSPMFLIVSQRFLLNLKKIIN